MKNIDLNMLDDLMSVGEMDLSPDGGKVAFDVARISEDDSYQSRIYLYSLEKGKLTPVTEEKKYYFPRWNGKEGLLFLSKGEDGTSLLTLDLLDSPSPVKIAEFKGSLIYYEVNNKGEVLFLGRKSPKGKDDIQKIDKIPFWGNGIGYTHDRPVGLYKLELNTGKVSELEAGESNVYSACYSNSGEKISYLVENHKKTPLFFDFMIMDKD